MKANLSPNLALKLSPNENYITKDLVGILWTELKLFISNWMRFDLYLPLLKTKKRCSFFISLLPTANHTAKLQLDIPEKTCFCIVYIYIIYTKYVVISENNLLNMK